MQFVLDYCYLGEAIVHHNDLKHAMTISETFKLKGMCAKEEPQESLDDEDLFQTRDHPFDPISAGIQHTEYLEKQFSARSNSGVDHLLSKVSAATSSADSSVNPLMSAVPPVSAMDAAMHRHTPLVSLASAFNVAALSSSASIMNAVVRQQQQQSAAGLTMAPDSISSTTKRRWNEAFENHRAGDEAAQTPPSRPKPKTKVARTKEKRAMAPTEEINPLPFMEMMMKEGKDCDQDNEQPKPKVGHWYLIGIWLWNWLWK